MFQATTVEHGPEGGKRYVARQWSSYQEENKKIGAVKNARDRPASTGPYVGGGSCYRAGHADAAKQN
jgi:hypothetical protein